jgi:CubicO group peptidase (beta-lactamase class C family)
MLPAPTCTHALCVALLWATALPAAAASDGAPPAAVAENAPLTAEQSDPRRIGWMRGVPPPPDKRITQPDSVYFSFPKLRWSVCHLRQLLPTIGISRGLGAPVPLAYADDAERERLQQGIDALTFEPLDGRPPMTWAQSLAANYTDGILVLHRDRVVYERYSGCLAEDGVHAAMSMTKSLTGLLAQILVTEGALDEHARVVDIVPEAAGGAYATATVRQVLDMTTGVRYSEDYADPDADIWKYSAAASPLPKPAGYEGPEGYFEYLAQVQPEGRHGEAFHYKTVDADMAGWLVARASGRPVNELASERLWRPMGAEQDASMTVDGIGTPFAGGGLSAGLRDMGRLGLLMLDEGVIDGRRLFPAGVVRRIRAGGDPARFGTAYPALVGGSYTSLWWVYPGEHEVIAARGVHGQTIYVDFTAQMVIVRFASFPKPQNTLIDPTSLPAFQALASYLRER